MEITEEEMRRVIENILNPPHSYQKLSAKPNYLTRDEDGWWAAFDQRPKFVTGSFHPVEGDTKILIAYHKTYDKPCCIPITKE